MGNECNSQFEISHNNQAMIDRFYDAYDRGELFEEFVSVDPAFLVPALGDDHGRNLVAQSFGFKSYSEYLDDLWGCSGYYNAEENSFSTNWSPADNFFLKLRGYGFRFEYVYAEPGQNIAGIITHNKHWKFGVLGFYQ